MVNMSFRYSDKKLNKQFKFEDRQPQIKYIDFENNTLRYLELVVDPELPYVVFIHGAPGSLADYLDYFRDERVYNKLNLISIDRLGYGNSDFGRSETSIQKQGEAIQSAIKKACKNDKIILLGHSYGGPIAVKMAMDFPHNYKALVLLAPALDPDNEKEIKMAQLPMHQPIRWLTPPALRVAADEKNTHVNELRKMLGYYDKVNIHVCHIHGNSDSLVPYENLAFSKNKFNDLMLESVTLEKADHFLPWSHHDFVVDKLLNIANTVIIPPSY